MKSYKPHTNEKGIGICNLGISILLVPILFLLMNGCGASSFQKIKNINILNSAPAYSGAVEVRITPQTSSGILLFEETVTKNALGGLPSPEFLEVVKKEGAKLGANVLIFQCGGAGTTGAAFCIVHGYRE